VSDTPKKKGNCCAKRLLQRVLKLLRKHPELMYRDRVTGKLMKLKTAKLQAKIADKIGWKTPSAG
jgi:hypothetical protein